MWVRKRLDIHWLDLTYALANCLVPRPRAVLAARLERLWDCHQESIACLSVRSGFDLWLSAVSLPRGSEVLVSAITIPDMLRIIEDHGLVPVPVDIDPDHLAIEMDSLKRAVTPRTRALLVAHLFGTRQPLEAIAEFAQQRGLLLVEDCAQAFVGRDFTGHPEADVSMFSFGPIKTATSLGGGLLRVRNPQVVAAMRRLLAEQPRQSRWAYLRRVLKYAGMKFLSTRPMYATVFHSWRAMGRDPDQLVNGAVRGFAGPDFFRRIRRQPSAPLLALVRRRIAQFDPARIAHRAQYGERLLALLDGSFVSPGHASDEHTYWVLPVLADDSARLIAAMREAGFDGSSAHSMCVVEPPADRPAQRAAMAESILPRIVYLPFYTQMPEHELERLATVLQAVADEREPVHSVAAPSLARTAR
ncbi:MAG TPA: aminotransferase class V-fold PLP-dependent enzyme [Pirellulales bacterium]|jgi:dTDP-4-amino-4,6-dideoxygalactose transaminase|nr:aminotransferase class V-fold PLP-dependent enzyme [Pirellulales bacterium]